MRLTFVLCFFLISFGTFAQQPAISFTEDVFDFGTIKEANGPVEHRFVFTNTGKAPLVIDGVRASCGCTTPAWSKEPVLPGDKGFVMAKFDPKNRPGQFRKSLTITSNAASGTATIFIQGNVAIEPKSPADQYPNPIGDLHFRYRSLNMSKVTTEKPVTRAFDVFNNGTSPITFSEEMDKPKHVSVSFQPQTIQPQASGKILITYDAAAREELGFVSDRLVLHTDEPADAEKDLRVIATIEEYFPPMTAQQLARAPKLAVDKREVDLGSMSDTDKRETEFNLTNIGKEELNIRAVKPNCGCTVTRLNKTNLKPGESVKLQVTFDGTGRRGRQQKSITIFSNDPSAPTQRLTVKARVNDVD
jgi:hypothetical protein